MLTLHDASTTYLLVQRSPETTKSYRLTLNRLEEFLGPSADLTAITTPDLLRFFDHIRNGLKPSSQATYTITVKTFFTWCAETMNYLQFSPAHRIKVKMPKPTPSALKTMPMHVLEGSYERAQQRRPAFAIRNKAILAFLDDTACRRKAVALLKISQLDLERFQAFPEEKGGGEQPLTFTHHAADALRAWLAIRPKRCKHDYVFTHVFRQKGEYRSLTPDGISGIINSLTEGISSRPYGPHSLRKLVAQDMYEHGETSLVVRDKLNHKHVETTESHYLYRVGLPSRKATDRRGIRRHPVPVSGGKSKIIPLDFEEDVRSV